ncbi:MAG TPA: divalent-cation tolerance protein CutA [Candidatus Thermoplasmatota archaeon]|nr:divalent-cation tolerance protein CutA [Candidatus Thermoplasmatota archaeon]
MNEFVSVYVTCPDLAQARSLAQALVTEELVACANMVQGSSVYRWEGALVGEPEVIVFLKTRRALVERVVAAVKVLHPAEVPCIVALDVVAGHAPFLEWVRANTRAP